MIMKSSGCFYHGMIVHMDTEKYQILIVEDEKDLRDALSAALRAAGFSVHTAGDYDLALKKAFHDHPDLMLLDINLADGKNGHDVLTEIRKDSWGYDAKVIFLTAYSDPENVIHAVEEGTIDYLVKPEVSLKDIVEKVQSILTPTS